MPIGMLCLETIRLVIEYLFIRATAEDINKSLEATIGLLFIIEVALALMLILEIYSLQA